MFYALGGGYGHLTRTRHLVEELKARVPIETLVLCPHRALEFAQKFSRCAGIDDIGQQRLARWTSRQLDKFQPDLLVVDTFPRGILGELTLPNDRPCVLVCRWVHPRYYQKPEVFQALDQFSEICWSEPRSHPGFPGIDCQPVLSSRLPLAREHARAILKADQRPWVMVLGSGPVDGQLALVRRLQRIATQNSWNLDFYSRELGTAREELAHLFAAADVIVSASGYNSYYESANLGVPTVWLPQKRSVDDQFRRASGGFPFSHRGPQRILSSLEDLEQGLEQLLGQQPSPSPRSQGREMITEVLLKHLPQMGLAS